MSTDVLPAYRITGSADNLVCSACVGFYMQLQAEGFIIQYIKLHEIAGPY